MQQLRLWQDAVLACMQAEESKKVESLIGLQSAIKFNGGGAAAVALWPMQAMPLTSQH